MTDRVLIVLQEDVVDGNTGDPLWPAGMRLEVDRGSAKVYVKTGVAVLAEDVDAVEDEPSELDQPPVPPTSVVKPPRS